VTNVVLLCMGAQATHEHVMLHALAKRRHWCIGRQIAMASSSLKGTPWSDSSSYLLKTDARRAISTGPSGASLCSLAASPDTATAEDIGRFQVHQHEGGAGPATINGAVSALRCNSRQASGTNLKRTRHRARLIFMEIQTCSRATKERHFLARGLLASLLSTRWRDSLVNGRRAFSRCPS
jgi:hypothetical protein